jgi:transcriptional regulator with XRE-family HTH domain
LARRSAEYAAFLRKLRDARAATGLSQAAVARRLGKPQSFVSKCESGERRVDVVELKAFAKAYGVPITYFV